MVRIRQRTMSASRYGRDEGYEKSIPDSCDLSDGDCEFNSLVDFCGQ